MTTCTDAFPKVDELVDGYDEEDDDDDDILVNYNLYILLFCLSLFGTLTFRR